LPFKRQTAYSPHYGGGVPLQCPLVTPGCSPVSFSLYSFSLYSFSLYSFSLYSLYLYSFSLYSFSPKLPSGGVPQLFGPPIHYYLTQHSAYFIVGIPHSGGGLDVVS